MSHATRAVNERVRLTGGTCAAHHSWPTLKPTTRDFAQRREEIRFLSVNEYEPVIHGLSFHSTRRAATTHAARTLDQSNRLAEIGEHFGTGQARNSGTNDEHI